MSQAASAPAARAAAPLAVFCGKGGVGKTTLCLAAALHAARAGHRVLAVTSHPLPELALTVSLRGLAEEAGEAGQRLFVIHLDPRQLVDQSVRRAFAIPLLARAILESSLYGNLIDVAPGLKELFFLSRLRELSENEAGAGPGYGLVCWDAPATGHFLSTLASARDLARLVTGPFAATGERLSAFFSQPERVRVFPVTTLEEMAMAETAELVEELRRRFQLAPRAAILNLASPALVAGPGAAAELDAALPDASPAMRLAILRAREELRRAESFAALSRLATVPVLRTGSQSTDLALLNRLGPPLEPVLRSALEGTRAA